MMYLPTYMGDRIIYFKTVLSEPEFLIQLIEKFDLDETTHSYLSKWENIENGIYIKRFIKNENNIEKTKMQKLLYIYNSFYSGTLFCREHYLNAIMKESEEIEDLCIYKINPSEENNEFFNIENSDTINFYMILNSEQEGFATCINKEYNIYLNLEVNSGLAIPGDIKHNIGKNKKNSLYYIKAKFKLKGDRLAKVNLF